MHWQMFFQHENSMNVVAASGIGLYNEYKLIRCSNFHKGVVMEYQLLIFLTDKLLKAVEVVSKDQYELVNIDGNEILEYHGEEGICKFCNSLKEYYSIDEFSDLEMEISLIYNEVTNHVIFQLA